MHPGAISRLLLPGIESTIHVKQAMKDCVACRCLGDRQPGNRIPVQPYLIDMAFLRPDLRNQSSHTVYSCTQPLTWSVDQCNPVLCLYRLPHKSPLAHHLGYLRMEHAALKHFHSTVFLLSLTMYIQSPVTALSLYFSMSTQPYSILLPQSTYSTLPVCPQTSYRQEQGPCRDQD